MPIHGRRIQFDKINVRRGNTEEITFRFKVDGEAMDLTDKEIVFRAAIGDCPEIRKSTTGDLEMPVPSNGEVTVTLTTTDTRSIPKGAGMPYEVENYTDQITLGEGVLIGKGGVNDD